ncbi:MAG: 16S rRNA (uracil(1498)-N(3))-methyltransferase [Roseburia sp.]|nr:16S rRNA (uracil(1498)-N(3))-methyltransferase [Roseburia sp.]
MDNMKEVRFFYAPDAPTAMELPEEEAAHAVRVLRLEQGDELMLADGRGTFYKAVITETTKKRCLYRIVETMPQLRQWQGHLHIAMAPTKNMDRTEWFAEKATEIGFDELTFLCCKFSERKVIKTERIDKILVSAMKQSHKAEKPRLNEMTDFMDFIVRDFPGDKYICHCYGDENEVELGGKRLLKDVLKKGGDALVLVGPEGDFSVDEVAAAEKAGFVPVSLGKSRLRTETAALVAVHIMNLFN